MRILFITQWFDPEPAFKGLDFAQALRGAGHEVQVLTGFPNYPEGRMYPGYRMQPARREMIDGIAVIRVALYPSHDRSAVRRVMNYVSFALSASMFGIAKVEEVDVVYVYVPPATAMVPALLLWALRRVPYVVDIQDLWPDTVAATGMMKNPIALGALDAACRVGYCNAQRMSVLSPGFKERLVERGVAGSRIEIVYNWAVEEQCLAGSAVPPAGWPEGPDLFRVLFAGNLGRAQGLHAVLGAARLLCERAAHIRFVILGDGVEAADLKRLAADLANVVFLGRVEREVAARCLGVADALLVHLEDTELFKITIPSKLQMYLAAGRPIVVGVRGDAADLVDQAQAGVACQPGDPVSIAEAVERLATMSPAKRAELGENGRRFYHERLSKRRGIDATVQLLAAATRAEGR